MAAKKVEFMPQHLIHTCVRCEWRRLESVCAPLFDPDENTHPKAAKGGKKRASSVTKKPAEAAYDTSEAVLGAFGVKVKEEALAAAAV